ncbi:spermatogenesis-associated protein 5-like protein 1 [Haliotis rufescens]|uniref:spermatogenesis-associated protein 5-like protein 1 n=1 Tax=Haliotis rufescens TaxID=6454 RepID=UPI00201F7ADE|nr:spermatogenesis-associated protein 5-like protein 1 [Haliotis rufescens]XP_048253750.1 spermatogenesis-associated protein 5-like protein 1 [Haliotis rufescens]
MDIEMQHVLINPVDSADTGQQKCRLGLHLIEQLSSTVGSYVRIGIKEKDYICSMWPHSVCPDNNTIQYDGCVFVQRNDQSPKSLHEPKNLNHNLVCRIQPLLISDAVCASVTVIVKSMEKYCEWKTFPAVQKTLKNYCLNCLRKKCVIKGCTVDLRTTRLAKVYGIVYMCVNSLSTKHDTDGGVVRELTDIIIDSVQSEERYSLSHQSNRFEMGGVSKVAGSLQDLLHLPLKCSSDFKHLGLPLPKGILLRGPPGCGKTSLVRSLAQKSQAALVTINGPEILSPHPGESEENVRGVFQKAVRMSQEGPCILFIDEIDSLCPKRGKSSGSNDSRVTSAVMSSMDALVDKEGLVIIGATNRPAALDPAVRRPGRFDREILMNVPNREQRREILAVHSARLPLAGDIDLDLLSDVTNGYVGADLASLCNEASYIAMAQAGSHGHQGIPGVEMCHFQSALRKVIPSLQKGSEGIVDLRPVQWDDIGGLEKVKAQIKQAVEWPLLYPEAFTRMGLPAPRGVLLYGPPGCCKTTLVRAAATATHSAFVSLSGAQLFSPFVGDSERMVTEVFQKSRVMAPTILFLDEIDSIVGKRSEGGSHRGVQERVLSTLLNEMDGIGIRLDDKTDSTTSLKEAEGELSPEKDNMHQKQKVNNNKVLMVAATNRPDLVDEAILRPGRIDRIIYVPPPDEPTRHEILKVLTRTKPLDNVDLSILSAKTDFYTGADLENICKEAAMLALTEDMDAEKVKMKDFIRSLEIVKPSLNQQLVDRYRTLGGRYRTS